MKKIWLFVIPICVLATVAQFTPVAFANTKAQEAQALVAKAVKFYQQNGYDKTVAALDNIKGQFVKGEFYVFMFDINGRCLAHSYNPKLIGKNLRDLRDANGVLFIQQFAKKVKAGGGWVDYQWTNPLTKKVQAKSTYVKGLPGTDYYVGCGIYK